MSARQWLVRTVTGMTIYRRIRKLQKRINRCLAWPLSVMIALLTECGHGHLAGVLAVFTAIIQPWPKIRGRGKR